MINQTRSALFLLLPLLIGGYGSKLVGVATAEVSAKAAQKIATERANKICAAPSESYERVKIGNAVISKRTLVMLENAQALYKGAGSVKLLLQGSYSRGFAPSLGTHDGGGVVDILPVERNSHRKLISDIPTMVQALRLSGFAAWYRPANSLYRGMAPHIHAVAIGDKELSATALEQITGENGYLRGKIGSPIKKFRGEDPHGGPVLCPWMTALGYAMPGSGTMLRASQHNDRETSTTGAGY